MIKWNFSKKLNLFVRFQYQVPGFVENALSQLYFLKISTKLHSWVYNGENENDILWNSSKREKNYRTANSQSQSQLQPPVRYLRRKQFS